MFVVFSSAPWLRGADRVKLDRRMQEMITYFLFLLFKSLFITFANERSCVFRSVCVSPLDYFKSYEQSLMKSCVWLGHDSRSSRLGFCFDMNPDRDAGIFKGCM